MAKTFAEIKTNVGKEVQDTSEDLALIIGNYINNRYRRCMRKINIKQINEDYQITVTAGTQDYVLPSAFDEELYCYDRTNKIMLEKTKIVQWVDDNPATVNDQDTPYNYAIFDRDDGSKYIRFLHNPSIGTTIDLPHKIKFTELSDDDDEPVLELDDILEIGAIADAWRYKKQFAKAKDFDVQFNLLLADWIFDQYSNANETHRFNPKPYSRETV